MSKKTQTILKRLVRGTGYAALAAALTYLIAQTPASLEGTPVEVFVPIILTGLGLAVDKLRRWED